MAHIRSHTNTKFSMHDCTITIYIQLRKYKIKQLMAFRLFDTCMSWNRFCWFRPNLGTSWVQGHHVHAMFYTNLVIYLFIDVYKPNNVCIYKLTNLGT